MSPSSSPPLVLIVGAAGYIGSTVALFLKQAGYKVWGLDNLSTGHRFLFPGDRFFFGNAGQASLVRAICQEARPEAVFHFAAKSIVTESLAEPQRYWANNVEQTEVLLDTLLEQGVSAFLFSSTCAVFGHSGEVPLSEGDPLQPNTPYGETKVAVEKRLKRLADQGHLRAVVLRYFNAAGADSSGHTGEWHEPETHLIPNLLRAFTTQKPFLLYGQDYPTPDGSCIRDYVHVSDLAIAHCLALEYLKRRQEKAFFETFHLGSGTGYSVKTVLQTAQALFPNSPPLSLVPKPRRPGDSARLLANPARAAHVLGWKPQHTLSEMISSAWQWEKKRAHRKRPALFLDRDNTLNEDPGYLHHPDQVRLLPGVVEGLRQFQAAGYLLIVVSNQSGIARGFLSEDTLVAIHRRLKNLLEAEGIHLHDIRYCPHHPKQNCLCRKPQPTLLHQAAQDWNLDLSASLMAGDRLSDVQTGQAAGCALSCLIGPKVNADSSSGACPLSFPSLEAFSLAFFHKEIPCVSVSP